LIPTSTLPCSKMILVHPGLGIIAGFVVLNVGIACYTATNHAMVRKRSPPGKTKCCENQRGIA
jgi:hypothetical protein